MSRTFSRLAVGVCALSMFLVSPFLRAQAFPSVQFKQFQ